MVAYELWMLNKTGGLIFNKEFAPGLPKFSTNARLKLSSAFHAQHAIAQQLSPVPGSGGIDYIEADFFKAFAFETPTAIKFVVLTDPLTHNNDGKVDRLFRDIYELYADYVLKNPFYEIEQPIRVEQWETRLRALVETWNHQ
eukprot:EG_transcript_31085